jgi:hypothetical protein
MHLNLIDRSNYFRGLLLLIGKNGEITTGEHEIIKKIAKILNYDQEFVENALDVLFENVYISKKPPEFSNRDFAKAFVKDGLKTAFADSPIHLDKIQWLRLTASKNNISDDWFTKELTCFEVDYLWKRRKSLSENTGIIKPTEEQKHTPVFEIENYITKESGYKYS